MRGGGGEHHGGFLWTDPFDGDTDGDGLGDADEYLVYQTEPHNHDSDSDGLWDADAIALGLFGFFPDSDVDSLVDHAEVLRGTDPLLYDTDGDSLFDGHEAWSDPLVADTDGDTLTDGAEGSTGTLPYLRDTDHGGASDSDEVSRITNPLVPADDGVLDLDGDGRNDLCP